LDQHDLRPRFQSGIVRGHSKEIAIVRLLTDALRGNDGGLCRDLTECFDISHADFDTVEHKILLSCFQADFNVEGTVRSWFLALHFEP